MCVKRAFKILKGRWRIIIKRVDVPLWNMVDMPTIYIVLHNMCVIRKDEFDME